MEQALFLFGCSRTGENRGDQYICKPYPDAMFLPLLQRRPTGNATTTTTWGCGCHAVAIWFCRMLSLETVAWLNLIRCWRDINSGKERFKEQLHRTGGGSSRGNSCFILLWAPWPLRPIATLSSESTLTAWWWNESGWWEAPIIDCHFADEVILLKLWNYTNGDALCLNGLRLYEYNYSCWSVCLRVIIGELVGWQTLS